MRVYICLVLDRYKTDGYLVSDRVRREIGVSYMSNYQDEEIIMVPVPKSRLAAVYAALNPAASQAVAAQPEESVEIPGQGTLTASIVGRLEAEVSNPGIRTLVTRLAKQAPQSLTFRDAVQLTGMESNILRAQLGSLSKISKRVLGYTIWPMQVRYAEGGEAIYLMDPKVAEWWLEAAQGS
jgi:hypothetical protein